MISFVCVPKRNARAVNRGLKKEMGPCPSPFLVWERYGKAENLQGRGVEEMKKIISMVLFMTLLFSFCPAYAEVQIGQGQMASTDMAQTENSEPAIANQTANLIEIFNDENCTIYFYKVEEEKNRTNVYFRVNNKTGRTLTFQSDCISINGESTDNIIMSDDVSPNSSGTISMSLKNYDKEYFDFKNISSLSCKFRIFDFNDTNFYDGKSSYSVTIDTVQIPCEKEPTTSGDDGIQFYDDERISIAYLNTEQDDEDIQVYFRVTNKTSDVLTLQCNSLGLNGESVSNIIASEDVAPHSVGNVSVKCKVDLNFVDIENITSLTGSLRIFAFDNPELYNGKNSYDIIF